MMILKLFSVFVSLLAVVASASPDRDPTTTTAAPTLAPLPTDSTFPPTAIVDPYVLRAVGEGGNTGRPYGTVVSTTPLTLVTFFEAHQSHFETGINEALTIEVYANVPAGQDCMTGTLLESVGEEFTLTMEATPYNEYNTDFPGLTGSSEYPVTSEGQVGAATVTISDFQYTPTDVNKNIWFPGRGDKDGDIELCVVTALKIDDDNNNGDDKEYYVSHMDSRKTISIDLMASMEAMIQVVPVDTFLCNNKHEPVRQEKKYTSGQNFRICVGPTEEGVHNGYKVDNYLELICDGRPLILPEVVADEDIGYKNNKLAIRRALTMNDGMDGKARITCTGIVSLSYTAPPTALRGLQPITGLVPSGGTAAADELLEGLFEVTIEMDTPSNNESSSAPLLSSMTTTVAVIIGVGSLLSIVSAMIW